MNTNNQYYLELKEGAKANVTYYSSTEFAKLPALLRQYRANNEDYTLIKIWEFLVDVTTTANEVVTLFCNVHLIAGNNNLGPVEIYTLYLDDDRSKEIHFKTREEFTVVTDAIDVHLTKFIDIITKNDRKLKSRKVKYTLYQLPSDHSNLEQDYDDAVVPVKLSDYAQEYTDTVSAKFDTHGEDICFHIAQKISDEGVDALGVYGVRHSDILKLEYLDNSNRVEYFYFEFYGFKDITNLV